MPSTVLRNPLEALCSEVLWVFLLTGLEQHGVGLKGNPKAVTNLTLAQRNPKNTKP